MDDPDITMEEYVQLETERALRNGKEYNRETATYGKILYDENVHYLRFFEIEFPVIVYNDAWAFNSRFSSEPTVSPQHFDEVDLKDETSLSEYNVIPFNDLFPFTIYYVNYSKLHMDNDDDDDDDKIDFKQFLKNLSIEPLPNLISINISTYAQGSNKILKTSHDTSSKFFKTETFIKELGNHEDLMTNTPYPEDLSAVCMWRLKNILEDLYRGPHSKKPQYVEIFQGWKPFSPLQLAVEEVISE
ncbi:hypothetical protein Tco_0566356 [Tanacetum coccineum]